MSVDVTFLLQGLPHRELTFAAGETVFHLGDSVRLVHFVKSGTIHLVRHQDDGAALILQRAGPGAILAEASVYSPRYHCDARAESSSVTWAIPRDKIRRRLFDDRNFADAWTHRLAREVQRARLNSEILSLKTVKARVDAWLLWHETLPGKGKLLLLAREIGVSPEALYRELSRRSKS